MDVAKPSVDRPGLRVEWHGRVSYGAGLDLQQAALEARRHGRAGDTLLLLEHPRVITLGRASRPEHLLQTPAELAARGIGVHEVARGGDVTVHAPGQLIGYLIVDLKGAGAPDLHLHVRRIEAALMGALDGFELPTRRVEGRSGVFVDANRGERTAPDRKLASIGIGVKRWVTYHGFALNVTTDLSHFDDVVACGLDDVEMTSVARESGLPELGLDARVRAAVGDSFVAEFSA